MVQAIFSKIKIHSSLQHQLFSQQLFHNTKELILFLH
jgi:hypothetical protein